MKLVFTGLWVVLVALGAAYGMALWMPDPSAAKVDPPVVLQASKTRVISVPMIADGTSQGFITMQFNYTVDADKLKAVKVPPEIYLIDEAFRTVYTDPTLDFLHLEKYDVNKLIAHLLQSTNERLGVPLIKEILVDNFAFIPKDAKE